ncbi:MAG TPA: trypsin-like peptidase domain-containing protein [Azoarcus taiwanensis]|uniref:Trypsin-like serine protease n=1 Tax=Azoarcus taiwanensis TaxID=666964 RepID=A0A972F6Q3_9RHOO|nr:trypsin-like peptidase domain-containing protein [Azoarcus taiwanensis]NMG02591.1 trypsin-like serine protease [Azoarcus taiwanensis]HRQ56446.1 trypsin-like peptidase domain-containing protein [Azoarcus taiwanensis]
MRRLWLIFAQTVTLAVAVLFVLSALAPEWLNSRPVGPGTLTIVQSPPIRSDAERVVPPGSYSVAAGRSMPAVVHILTSRNASSARNPLADDPFYRHFFGDRDPPRQSPTGQGSGVIVSKEGYILTNNHVVETADGIEVSLNDGRRFPAELIGRDPETDLAVLRIADAGDLPAIAFSAPDSLEVGDVVLAIGNPFGVGQTVTMGIVSALGRTRLGISTFENYIQTDAAINPGNSGGALVDASGDLVGINTAIYSRSGGSLGIGFAIPVSLARDVLQQIVANGEVTRGWVGVEIRELVRDLDAPAGGQMTSGAMIAGVLRGSPAERAGLRPGDILVAMDDQDVRGAREMLEMVAARTPGDTSRFRVRRNASELELDVRIGRRPTQSGR